MADLPRSSAANGLETSVCTASLGARTPPSGILPYDALSDLVFTEFASWLNG
jgi:hypothetical protein